MLFFFVFSLFEFPQALQSEILQLLPLPHCQGMFQVFRDTRSKEVGVNTPKLSYECSYVYVYLCVKSMAIVDESESIVLIGEGM